MKKRIIVILLAVVLAFALVPSALAKTNPAGQTVGNVLFYVTNSRGEQILVSQIPVATMEADMKAGKIDTTVHNYSLLDKFTTTLHQEAQGFTVTEFLEYAQGKSTVAALRNAPLSWTGSSTIRFWEIDQSGYDSMDTYTYADLYGAPRYNFPALYEYWDYAKQDYYDPSGKMSRAQVIDYIFAHGEPEVFLLSVRAFSQRYMVTDEKYGIDYNMENYWYNRGLLDNERTIRVMKPMTRDELYAKTPTASDTRYWTANILLDMAARPNITSLGTVAAPTATMTDFGDNYYIRFSTTTAGATILYNHNFISPSYTPTSPYGDGAVIIPKSAFPNGTVTMTARAVKEGYTDAGVVTLTLQSSGTEQNPETSATAYSDVPEAHWAFAAVNYVMEKKLFDLPSKNTFGASSPMTRAALAVALYRLEGSPDVTKFVDFTDVSKGTPLSAAVSWCNAAGIVLGNGDGTFAPDKSITREQIAAMIYRYAAYKRWDLSAKGNLSVFPDNGKISTWAGARESLVWANGMKYINGTANNGVTTIDPQGTATRAQVAQILYNMR
ncbi:MAG: S-layer homology domain-containing protein [Oscillospiraceae bacterium]|jgi:hypothetical protein|nr:S-layer homology domain-containing protein [Oscillospiraceae bacterium]